MPRRREVPKREILPDPKFHNTEVAKFINVLMSSGKNRLQSAFCTALSTRLKLNQVKTRSRSLRKRCKT